MIKGINSNNCPVDVIREYIEQCMRMQEKCREEYCPVPKEYLIPEEIVLSEESVRFFANSSIVDIIGAGEKGKGGQFYWKASEKYPALEVRVALDEATGRYLLTYLREEAGPEKDEFVWDSSTKEGKMGLIVFVKKEDSLEDVYDVNHKL